MIESISPGPEHLQAHLTPSVLSLSVESHIPQDFNRANVLVTYFWSQSGFGTLEDSHFKGNIDFILVLLSDIESRPPKSLDEIVVRDSLTTFNPGWNIDFELNVPYSHVLNTSLEVNSIGVVDEGINFGEEDEGIL